MELKRVFNWAGSKVKNLLKDIKYVIRVRRIIVSNRNFFFNFYFKRHLPDTLARLAAERKQAERLESIEAARATTGNLLESIEEAADLAKKSVRNPIIRNLAVAALRREFKRYLAIKLPDSAC